MGFDIMSPLSAMTAEQIRLNQFVANRLEPGMYAMEAKADPVQFTNRKARRAAKAKAR